MGVLDKWQGKITYLADVIRRKFGERLDVSGKSDAGVCILMCDELFKLVDETDMHLIGEDWHYPMRRIADLLAEILEHELESDTPPPAAESGE